MIRKTEFNRTLAFPVNNICLFIESQIYGKI